MSQEGADRASRKVRGVLDRLEGEFAVIVLEGGGEVHWPKGLLPPGAREGVAIEAELGLDEEMSLRSQKRIKKLLDELFSEGGGQTACSH